MKIIAQGYTIRAFTADEKAVAQSLGKLKQAGFSGLQLSGFGFNDYARINELAGENGIKIHLTHTPIDRILNDTDAVIAEHKLFGAEYVGLGYYKLSSASDCDALNALLKEPVKKMKDSGLKFVYHNHHHEFVKEGGRYLIDYLLKGGNIGLLADLYWVAYAGINPVDFLDSYRDFTEVVHLKDLKINAEFKQCFAEIYEGNINYDAIIEKCLQIGVKYAAIEQDVCDGDPFDSLSISLNNIKKRGFIVEY